MASNPTVPPKLQSPGAGLPALELAFLQTMFRCACALISLDAGLRWFKFEARKIVVLARSVAAEQGGPPRPDQSSRGNRGQQPLLVGVHGARSSADC